MPRICRPPSLAATRSPPWRRQLARLAHKDAALRPLWATGLQRPAGHVFAARPRPGNRSERVNRHALEAAEHLNRSMTARGSACGTGRASRRRRASGNRVACGAASNRPEGRGAAEGVAANVTACWPPCTTGTGHLSSCKLRDVEIPRPAADEILVRVHCSSVARSDVGVLRAKPFVIRLVSGLFRGIRGQAEMAIRPTGQATLHATSPERYSTPLLATNRDDHATLRPRPRGGHAADVP